MVSKVIAFKVNRKYSLFVSLTVHPIRHQLGKHCTNICCNFVCWLSPLIDSTVLGVVCFACLWNLGSCLQAPQILLSELTDIPLSALLVVGIVLCFLECFGFFVIVSQLFSSFRNLFVTRSACCEALKCCLLVCSCLFQ